MAEQVTSKWHPGPDRADVHGQPRPRIILLSQRCSVFSNGREERKQKTQPEEIKQDWVVRCWLVVLGSPGLSPRPLTGACPYAPDSAQRASVVAEAGTTCFHLEDALQFYKSALCDFRGPSP